MLSIALASALLLAPSADAGTRVVVLPIVADAGVGAHTRVAEQLAAGLARGDVTVVPDAEVRAAIVGDCLDAACVRDVAARVGARWVVRPRLEHRDRSYTIELELLDGTTGDVAARNRDECEICGLEEVGALAADQAAVLQRQIAGLGSVQTSLHIESTPPGARVWLDGELIGVTPLLRQTTAGRHRLRVHREGYVVDERTIEVIEDIENDATLRLDPLPPDSTARRGPPLVPIGLVSIIAGVALVGGGASLVAIDGRQYRRQCNGDDVDINGTCRFSYDTLAGGAVALAAGVAASAAGIALVVVGKRRARATVAIGPKGWVVRGRF